MIGRICQRDVDTAESHEPVRFAAQRMHERAVGTLVVLNEKAKPIGIVTDRDLVTRAVAAGLDPETTAVRQVMTASPITICEDEPVEMALKKMRQGPLRRLPVVDAQGALVGLVSVDDIISLLAEEFADIGALLERETPRAVSSARW
jgi:CBS domain-containing protein